MSSLSWLFGKKKPGSEGPSMTVSPRTFEESEGFSFVELPTNLYPTLDDGTCVGATSDTTNLPYNVGGNRLDNQNKKPPLLPSDSLPHNPLQDIPFKLNSQLDIDVTDLEVFLFNVNAVLSKAVHVNENIIKYNFATERSVINEEQCANNDFS